MLKNIGGGLLALAAIALPAGAQKALATPTGKDVSVGSPLAVTFYLPLKDAAGAEAKAQSLQTPGSWDYHKFLSLQQFVTAYGPSDADVAAAESYIRSQGFTVTYVFANHLAIEAMTTAGNAERVFSTKLAEFEKDGHKGIAPVKAVSLPFELQGKVIGVGGLNTLPRARPMHVIAKDGTRSSGTARRSFAGTPNSTLTGGTPGDYLPSDFEKLYNVTPLYNQKLKGAGKTIGIVTLNDFDEADAYNFWKAIGLTVSPTRISKVDVDGGVESPYNNLDGQGETALDVEQSGAIAFGAKVRVYVGPVYTNSGFTNAFEQAASENIADTVSTSWGEPELYYFPSTDGVSNPSETFLLDAFHEVFLEMALQGQTLFAATGDSGAFDTVRGCSPYTVAPSPKDPLCNAPYTVDHPASDPIVFAAGGTTLPFGFTSVRSGVNFYIGRERAWAWDYFPVQSTQQGRGGYYPLDEFFSVGDGGGVSSYFPTPWYQRGVKGIKSTVSNQYLTYNYGTGSLEIDLPSHFAGRNLPDLSTNADPETGYQVLSNGELADFYGGTSFVSPQLNGVTALLNEGVGGRLGQLNASVFQLKYNGSNDLASGDNWGYDAVAGYDDAVGVGTLDAAKLLSGLKSLK